MNLNELRDRLAEEYDQFQGKVVTFKAGWSALLNHLEGAAGEMKFEAFEAEYQKLVALGDWMKCQHIARWQFDQCKARIALAEIKYKTLSEGPLKGSLRAIAELQAKLAEMNQNCISLFLHEQRMGAVEAKLAESEFWLCTTDDGYIETWHTKPGDQYGFTTHVQFIEKSYADQLTQELTAMKAERDDFFRQKENEYQRYKKTNQELTKQLDHHLECHRIWAKERDALKLAAGKYREALERIIDCHYSKEDRIIAHEALKDDDKQLKFPGVE